MMKFMCEVIVKKNVIFFIKSTKTGGVYMRKTEVVKFNIMKVGSMGNWF